MLSPSNSLSWLFGLIRSYVPLLPLRFVDIYWKMGNTYTFYSMPLSIFKILSWTNSYPLSENPFGKISRFKLAIYNIHRSVYTFVAITSQTFSNFNITCLGLADISRETDFIPFAFQCFDSSLWTRVKNLQTLHPGQYDMASLNTQHSSPRPSTSSQGFSSDSAIFWCITRWLGNWY